MQSLIDLQNTLTELQYMITNTIDPVFTDLQNGSQVFNPVIASHDTMIQKIDEMISFLNSGVIQGLKGDKGDSGISAYDLATINGFVGTVNDWLLSLKGDKGDKGDSGVNAPLGLLYETTVTGSAVTSINIPNLDILTHKNYRIEIDFKNATASALTLKLYANGDVTPANYAAQSILSSSTTTTSSAISDALIGYCEASSRSLTNADISLSTDGYFRFTSQCSRGTMTLPTLSNITAIKKATITNLTQLTLSSSVASSIGIGTRVRIFRGDA
jgi:hypothetical protein